jgi:hypothetical protein
LTIALWSKGYDPFPEAVKPTVYTYYPSDASGRGRGVLVQAESAGTGNASLGGFESPVYATTEIDRQIASLVSADEKNAEGARSGSATTVVAMTLVALCVASMIVAKRIAR